MLRNIAFCFLSMAVIVARGKVDVKMTPAMRPHCHIIRFPEGWIYPMFATGSSVRPHSYNYDSIADYEFRARGSSQTTFLISGVNILDESDRFYTNNQYEIDLSDSRAVPRPVSDEAWRDSNTIALTRTDVMDRAPLQGNAPFKFLGHAFERSGRWWSLHSSRLSPDHTWLVLQSLTEVETYIGEAGSPFGGTGRYKGKLFWDVFNAETGKKVLTITGTYLDTEPNSALRNTAWLTDRYFIIALGEHRERCLVCEFRQAETPKL